MKNIIALILSIATFISGLTAASETVTAQQDTDDFVPVLRFAVMSDTHVALLGGVHARRIQRALSLAYDDAQNDPQYKSLDAAVFAGDLTDSGLPGQFIAFKAAVDSVLRPETQFLAISARYHDGYAMGKLSLSFFEKLTGQTSDYHVVIRGFHFIGLSQSKTFGEHYSAYQRTWLREQLESAAAVDPDKPIFVTQHEPLSDTVYGSVWGIDDFADILCEYPQVIDFAGHSHYPLNDPRSIWQGDFTALATGTLHYINLSVDDNDLVFPKDLFSAAQLWIAEVDARNSVRLRGFDALSGALLCSYTVHDPANADAREYTPMQQQAAASPPSFGADAAIMMRKELGRYSVFVPAAESTDGGAVVLYRLRITDANGTEKYATYFVNNYWRADSYETISFRVFAKSGDMISVTAENAYGMCSDALSAAVG